MAKKKTEKLEVFGQCRRCGVDVTRENSAGGQLPNLCQECHIEEQKPENRYRNV